MKPFFFLFYICIKNRSKYFDNSLLPLSLSMLYTAKKIAYELIHHENQQKPTPAFSSSIDDAINQENQVRLIDLL
jgi:hypothetical protein